MPSVRSGRQPVFRCGRSPTGSSTRRTGPRPLIPTGMENDAGAISQELQHAVHVLPLQPPRRLRARAVPPAAAAAAQLQQLLLGRGGPAAAHAHGARCRVWTALLSPVSQPGPILDTASSLQGEYRASLSIRTSTGGQRLHLLTTILDPVRTDGKTDVVLGGGMRLFSVAPDAQPHWAAPTQAAAVLAVQPFIVLGARHQQWAVAGVAGVFRI